MNRGSTRKGVPVQNRTRTPSSSRASRARLERAARTTRVMRTSSMSVSISFREKTNRRRIPTVGIRRRRRRRRRRAARANPSVTINASTNSTYVATNSLYYEYQQLVLSIIAHDVTCTNSILARYRS